MKSITSIQEGTLVIKSIKKTVLSLWQKKVEEFQNEIAVVEEEKKYTYKELEAQSTSLANKIIAIGIKPGTNIGICLERSIEVPVAILGILKAGCTYVPLEPSFPKQFFDDVIANANLQLVLTNRKFAKKVPSPQHLFIEEAVYDSKGQLSLLNINSSDLVYIIYTSGSTGKPKGVEMSNEALFHYLLWCEAEKKEKVRTLQLAPLCFDISFQEYFSTWMAGGSIFILPESIKADPLLLLEFIDKNSIERLFITYAHLVNVAEISQTFRVYPHLKEIIIFGEPFVVTQVLKDFFNKVNAKIINLYGATEIQVIATYECSPFQIEQTHIIPVGKPITGTYCLIVDKNNKAVPVGKAGELCVYSKLLFNQYHNNLFLTKMKIIKNPEHANNPALPTHLYNTGDVALINKNGDIEILGRKDGQVKIRGFRVELGSVEKALKQCANVLNAAVVARKDKNGRNNLVCYVKIGNTHSHVFKSIAGIKVILDSNSKAQKDHIRKELSKKIPRYMIPSIFVVIDHFPLNINGKVDKRNLPCPYRHNLFKDGYIEPDTQTERILCNIWGKVLKADDIGVEDDFFSYGGDSLLVTHLKSNIKEKLGIEVSFSDLYEHSTPKKLGAHIESSKNDPPCYEDLKKYQPINELQPLSKSQNHIWAVEEMTKDKAVYNIPFIMQLKGSLNISSLELALSKMIERHSILRTIFMHKDGKPYQKVQKHKPFTFEKCSRLFTTKDEYLKEHLFPRVVKKMELDKSCFHATIYEAEKNDFIFTVVFHHIIIDGWSIEVFFKELSKFYNHFTYNERIDLKDLTYDYADYVLWQENWLKTEYAAKQLTYWRNHLNNFEKQIGISKNKTTIQRNYSIAEYSIKLHGIHTRQFFEILKKEKATIYMGTLALVKVLLYRFNQQKDLIIGAPLANRTLAGSMGILGLFINTLPLRTQLDEKDNFITVLKKVKLTTVNAYENQMVPLENIFEALKISRYNQDNPLFGILFTLDNNIKDIGLKNIASREIKPPFISEKFGLSIIVKVNGETINICFEYDKSVYNSSTVQRFLEHLNNLLKAVVQNPFQDIKDLDIFSKSLKEEIFKHAKGIISHNDLQPFVHKLFEEKARMYPSNSAIIYLNEKITYLQLNQKANQLARHLCKTASIKNSIVGIALKRCPDLIIAMLAVLKAGAAYAVLDITQPKARLQKQLHNVQAKKLIIHSQTSSFFTECGVELITVDKGDALIEKENDHNLDNLMCADDLAYVVFTSGSSGVPKGVMIEHRNLVHYLYYANKTYIKGKGATLLHTSLAFDMNVASVFMPLMNGDAIYVIPENHDSYKEQLLASNMDFNFIELTPTHLKIIEHYVNVTKFREQAGSIIIGGERVLKDDIKEWINVLPIKTFFNEYGPTETTIGCSSFKIDKNFILNNEIIPIGKPIDNTEIYILDKYFNLVPKGVAGEIYIGGGGVCRGYFNNPCLTAQSFMPNPFIDKDDIQSSNLRLYRTGDFGKLDEDGNIEYLYRGDDQIKRRGFRIELGEIEAISRQHEDILEAIAVVEDEAEKSKLLLYISLKKESLHFYINNNNAPYNKNSFYKEEFFPDLTEALYAHLNRLLPSYMVPDRILYLNSLPMTSNGKLDRNNLPKLNAIKSGRKKIEKPCTEIQIKLYAILKCLLNVNELSVDSNIFRLGADSILALQLVSKARKEGLTINIEDVFKYPTIALLSSAVNIKKSKEIPFSREEVREGFVPLTPIQHWFFENDRINKNGYHQTILLKIKHGLDYELLSKSFQNVMAQHDTLRYQYSQNEKYEWQQFLTPNPPNVSLEVMSYPCQVIEELCQGNVEVPWEINFDIKNGPLLKGIIIENQNKDAKVLVISMHHLVVDAVSWMIIVDDLERIYYELINGTYSLEIEKTHSYQQWSRHLASYSQSITLKEYQYWREVEQNITKLPYDAKADLKRHKYASLSSTLDKSNTCHLLGCINQSFKAEINDILITALVLTFGGWKGSYTLSFSIEGHGREQIIENLDLSHTVGWFTSLYPVNIGIEDPNNISLAISAVAKQLRAIPNKGIGYGCIKYLNTNNDLKEDVPSLCFNNLGFWATNSVGKLFEIIRDSDHQYNPAPYLLEINVGIIEEKLIIKWTYAEEVYSQELIFALIRSYLENLIKIIKHCTEGEKKSYAHPALIEDFTEVELETVFRDIPNIESIYELSSIQEGILYQSLFSKESDLYHVQCIYEVEGLISIERFKEACQDANKKYDILRSGFKWEGLHKPLQYVSNEAEISLYFEDCQTLSKMQVEKKIHSLLQRDRITGFDMSKPSLSRWIIIKFSESRFFIIWSHHHILLDGWSAALYLQEIARNYYSTEKSPTFTLPYKAYIDWLKSQDLTESINYWSHYLKGYYPQKTFQIEKEERQGLSETGLQDCVLYIPKNEMDVLTNYSQQAGITFSSIFIGALSLAVKSNSQASEVVLGVTVSGRHINIAGIEEMVGLFINTLPIRISFNPQMKTKAFLEAIQHTMRQHYNHSHVSLADITSQQKNRSALFDVVLNIENYENGLEFLNSRQEEIYWKELYSIEKTEYPLTILVIKETGKIQFTYQSEGINEELIQQFGKKLLLALKAMCHSDVFVGAIHLVGHEEQERINSWNEREILTSFKPIHRYFEEQVKLNPKAIALVCKQYTLTYEELNKKANYLAHLINRHGGQSGDIIAFTANRTCESIIAMLAILKIGGAYLPIDISYPFDRISFILEDSKPSILLCSSDTAISFSFAGTVISIAEALNKAAVCGNSATEVHAQQIAYTLYTSGSSGSPKGVMVTHEAVINFLHSFPDHYQKKKVCALWTNLGFDVSTYDVWMALLFGSQLIILDEEQRLDPEKLINILAEKQINQLYLPPFMLIKLLPILKQKDYKLLLQTLLVGVEPIASDILEEVCTLIPGIIIVNGYGPTETTVCSTLYDFKFEYTTNLMGPIPIGKPINNTKIYILDKYFNLLPIGSVGEIYISGIGLSQGYLGCSRLTAEKFIPNPFINHKLPSDLKYLRLYKTGDLGRYLSNGHLEFKGRDDSQIKIRGVRIDLGEIEHYILQYKHVIQCKILYHNKSNVEEIIAYIVKLSESKLDSDLFKNSLKNYLKKQLPYYMVPNSIILLDSLPVNVNGKIDTQALLNMVSDEPYQENLHFPIKTGLESDVQGIWENVLNRKSVSREDNFFDLGGHSFLAMQIISKINFKMGLELPFKTIFEYPTVSLFSQYIESILSKASLDKKIEPVKRNGKYLLSIAQEKIWLFNKFYHDHNSFVIFLEFKLSGILSKPAFLYALNKVIERHEMLRANFIEEKGKPYQIIKNASAIDERNIYHDISQLKEIDKTVYLKTLKREASTFVGLNGGPLFKAKLVCLNENQHIFMIALHHIISDAWSTKILLQDISLYYNDFFQGEKNIKPLLIQYIDYASWQKAALSQAILDKKLMFWEKQLDDIEPIQWPATKQPEINRNKAVFNYTEIPEDLYLMLRVFAKDQKITMFSLLYSIFQLFLSSYTAQEKIIIGVPVSNRNMSETQDVIGIFIDTLPLKVLRRGELTFLDFLIVNQDNLNSAYNNQEASMLKTFPKITNLSNTHPLFQVIFTVEEEESVNLELENMQIEALEVTNTEEIVDLYFHIQECKGKARIVISYLLDLFDELTIREIAYKFLSLARYLISNSSCKLQNLPLMIAGEKEIALKICDASHAFDTEERNTFQLIDEKTKDFSEKIALIYRDKTLAYYQVNEQSNTIAKHLIALGYFSSPIAVSLGCKIEWIVAMLGILKAGCIYVPLDLDYPMARKNYMLHHSKAKAIITSENLKNNFSFWDKPALIFSDLLTSLNANFEIPFISNKHPAYIIFTSGSTGKPRGVIINHDALVSSILAQNKAFGINHNTRALQLASFAFDVSIFEVLSVLSVGGTLLCVDKYRSSEELIPLVKKFYINTLAVTGSHLESFPRDKGLSVDTLIVGGEVISQETLEFWSNNRLLFNAYGPTEATICATVMRLKSGMSSRIIGQAIRNVLVYILNENMDIVPVGSVGEICLGGDHLADGYINDPWLTAEKFVPNPFCSDNIFQLRLYRTGDLARYLPDGNIEYLGRKDSQVKIRGTRIELEEIKTVLMNHPKVSNAYIQVFTQNKIQKLIAYIEPKKSFLQQFEYQQGYASESNEQFSQLKGEDNFSKDLNNYVMENLPQIMHPQHYLYLNRMPLNYNHKIDYKALSLITIITDPKKHKVRSLTNFEKEIADLWKELLNIETVDLVDNFFELGGHSLLASQLLYRIKNKFSVEISFLTIFNNPVLFDFAQAVGAETTKALNHNDDLTDIAENSLIPLSFSQQRIWFLSGGENQGELYNVPLALHISGKVNIQALENAFNAIIKRHQILRTVFLVSEGTPSQKVLSTFKLDLKVNELFEENNGISEAQIENILSAEASVPFNLRTGPLIRVKLLKLDKHQFIMMVVMHHIIIDGWSMKILFNELSAYYRAYCSNVLLNLPELPMQYGEHAKRETSLVEEKHMKNQLLYWKEKLKDVVITEMHSDEVIESVGFNKGDSYTFNISIENALSLKKLAIRENATLFMVVMSMLQVFYYRLTGNFDTVIGTPIAGRRNANTEELIGHFINIIPIRNRFEKRQSFTDVLRNVKATILEAYDNQDIPFEKVIEALAIERAGNKNPLFQMLLTLQNAEKNDHYVLEGLAVKHYPIKFSPARLDLAFNVYEDENIFEISIEYSTRRFRAETIKRMADQLQNLIKECLDDPLKDINFYQLSHDQLVCTPSIQPSILATTCNFIPIHAFFEQEAGEFPENIAVVDGCKQVTYDVLNKKSNQLARYLQHLGVCPNRFVAIAGSISFEVIISILAVLKAGGAYVPLDAEYPKDRLRYMLEDTKASVLLLNSSFDEIFNTYSGTKIYIDRLEFLNEFDDNNLKICNHPDDLAYQIYTSGSTGKPKGVMVTHNNLQKSTSARLEYYKTNPSRYLLMSSFSFDSSIAGLFWPLTSHGTLVLYTKLKEINGAELVEVIKEQKITHLLLVPSVYKILLDLIRFPLYALQCIIVAGESIDQETLERHCYHLPKTWLYNEYGPTEACVWSSVECLYDPVKVFKNTISIGRPLSHVQMWVLDQGLRSVPVGVIGEIYLGGEGIALGYWNNPKLTAENFIPNPFIAIQEKMDLSKLRLYRTGDLARILPNFKIQIIGRRDDQVKVRGYRVQLSDIEETLKLHGDVYDAIVITKKDVNDISHLVAFLICREFRPSENEISFFLSEKLPHYMLPNQYIFLNEWPRTPNSKINKQALLTILNESIKQKKNDFIAPATNIEEELCKLWQEFFNLNSVSIEQDFFKLGGHSLLAARLISCIQERYQVKISIAEFFDNPTIKSLAKFIDETLSVNQLPMVTISDQIRTTYVPLSYAQQRLWFLQELNPHLPLYNMPFAYRLYGRINIPALKKAFLFLISRHESLRTHIFIEHGHALQNILKEVPFDIEVIDILKDFENNGQLQEMIDNEANALFDLTKAPLFRVKLFKISEEEYVMSLIFHHIIVDGWSMNIFFKELGIIYEAYCHYQPPNLPHLQTHYQDFAVWQRNQLAEDNLQQHYTYWKQKLIGGVAVEFPLDKERPNEPNYQADHFLFTIPSHVKAKINWISENEKASLFMVMLSAIKILIYQYTQETDIIVGTPIANRQYKEIENTIGFFVNTLALRDKFEPFHTFVEVLNIVKQTTLEAYEFQDIPFEKIIDGLDLSRVSNQNPLFQIMFTLHNADNNTDLLINGLEIKRYPIKYPVARFDLFFKIFEEKDSLLCCIEYASELFESSTIEHIAARFQNLILQLAGEPHKDIHQLTKLSAIESEQMSVKNNIASTHVSLNIVGLFENQVIKSPFQNALVYKNEKLSYEELNKKANQLAHCMRDKGIKRGSIVAIALEKCCGFVIAALAALKLGASYLPVDCSLPLERIKYILSKSKANIILQNKNGLKLKSIMMLSLDLDEGAIWQYPIHNLGECITPYDAAYILFTSGSTGTPKGVVIEHGSLINYVQSIIQMISNQDKQLKAAHVSSFLFDLGNTALYPIIAIGGEIHLLDGEIITNGYHFNDYVQQHEINFLKITPAHFDSLLLEGKINEALPYKYLFFGGERLTKTLINKINLKVATDIKILNHYGPTETTIGCSAYLIDKFYLISKNSVPIGKALSNIKIYILNDYLEPVPLGAKGNIYVSGLGVARGYLNEPNLTALKFIPNPFITHEDFKNNQHLRLYHTGDIGRFLSDGNIEYIARSDDQVKIRGFRIELQEIEGTLNTHGDVSKAIILTKENSNNEVEIIAFIVSGEFTTSEHELKEFLKEKLPIYMMPKYFYFIDKIPLNSNGKVDKKELLSLSSTMGQAEEDFSPKNIFEKELIDIWTKLLGKASIGRNTDFFKLGGDSISSIKMVSKIHELGYSISVKDIFDFPILKNLASFIEKKTKPSRTLLPSTKVYRGEVPLTPIQHWFFNLNLANPNHYNQAIMIDVPRSIDISILEKAIISMIDHHDVFHYRYQLNPMCNQFFNNTNVDNGVFSVVDLTNNPSFFIEIKRYTTDLQKSLQIEKGVLFKTLLFKIPEEQSHKLLIVAHHLIIDAISWQIFIEELEATYIALAQNRDFKITIKSNSYQEWAFFLKQYAQPHQLESELEYWRSIIAKIEYIPHDTVALAERKIKRLNFEFDSNTTQILLDVYKFYNVKMNEILLTGLVMAYGKWKDKFELGIYLEGHGREDIAENMNFTQTIGWFTSLYPVYLKIHAASDVFSAIQEVKKQMNDIPNNGIGFGILAYCASLINKKNIATIRFNYLGNFQSNSNEALFSVNEHSIENCIDERNVLPYALDIILQVRDGCLEITCGYRRDLFNEDSIKLFLESYRISLQQIASAIKENRYQLAIPFENSEKAKATIFFIHPIGGEVFWYESLSRVLSKDFNSYGIKSLFLLKDMQVLSIEAMAEAYVDHIVALVSKGPILICGWSFGAILAYEISRRLTMIGFHVLQTIIIDQKPSIDHQRIYRELDQLNKQALDYCGENINLYCKVKHYQLLKNYFIDFKINKILLLKSMELLEETDGNNFLGWDKFCNEIHSITVGKDHYDIMNEEYSQVIADAIKASVKIIEYA